MANSLSLTSSATNAGIMECPVCRQTIDASSTQCRFCSAAIDPVAAEKAAESMARLNQACSDAGYLRAATIGILVFFGLMFVPFLSFFGIGGYYFLALAVPFLAIRWWVKFHAVRADEADFRRARMTVIVCSALGALPLLMIVSRWL